MKWIDIFKHLLPDGKALRITIEKPLRKFFEGLTDLPSDIQSFFDLIYLDLFPSSTRFINFWEDQFAQPSTGLTERQRRDRLDAVWKATGGQSPKYIQDTLQNAGFDVYVHESWNPVDELPIGTQGCIPRRDPNDYLSGGVFGSGLLMFDGGGDSQDGDALSQDGSTSSPVGYPLVNIIQVQGFVGDGMAEMQDGGQDAQDGGLLEEFVKKTYTLPTDPEKFAYFLYIGGQSFPDQASVPATRKDEFETLCLKICPAHLWLGILVNYN